MLKKIESLIHPFRECFSRESSFKWFVISVIAFMLRGDQLGVTSFIRDLALDGNYYETLLHFFRSSAYKISELRCKWYRIIASNAPLHKINDRAILIGDGVKQCKEARRMPGVKKMTQESETCSKPEYIFGHMFGAVGVVVSNKNKRFCLPLKINIQDGLRSAASWEESAKAQLDISDHTHIDQMIECSFEAASEIGRSYLLLDRYFLTKSAIRIMNKLNAEAACQGENLIEIITKAKSNYTAYRHPHKKKGSVGRRPKRGSSVKIFSLFNQKRLFKEGTVTIYGKKETVSYYSHKLLWGPGLYQELLFVLVECNGKRSVLVSTDTTLDPFTVIELYAVRFGIEELFREYKQQVGGLSYHFWTKSIPKLNHFKKKDDPDPLSEIQNSQDRMKVLNAIHAIEMFVFCSSVSMGILQLLALDSKVATVVINARYLRTKSNTVPSEASVMHYLRKTIFVHLGLHPGSFITRYISEKQIRGSLYPESPKDDTEGTNAA